MASKEVEVDGEKQTIYYAAGNPYKSSGNTYLVVVEVSAPADNTITLTTEKVDIFTVEVSDDVFKFKSAEKGAYLGFKGKDNNITYDNDSNVEWSVTIEDGAATIQLNGQDTQGNDRFFQFNKNVNQERFATYKNTQVNPSIYRKVVTE